MTSPASARPKRRTTCAAASRAERSKHKVIEGAGHYGIFSGRRWRETVYPQVRDFIRQFDRHSA